MDAAGVIAVYVLDRDRPLTTESSGNTTFYLYGLGAIGEKTTDWNFSLPDGTNTPRQLSDINGDITLSARYTPWGDMLETYGSGNFTFGYFGGVMDAATGLIYVGNGQYYDPSTGRFLTRSVNPDSTNPYVPWNPIGAILGPLALVSLFHTRKKKTGKAGTFLALLLVLGSVGVIIAACGPAPIATPVPPNPQPTETPDNSAPTVPPGAVTPGEADTIPSDTPEAPPSPTNTPVATPCATPTYSSIDDELRGVYQAYFENGINGTWPEAYKSYVLAAVRKVNEKISFASVFSGFRFVWGCATCSGFAYTYPDRIEFRDFFSVPETNAKFIIHELGHAFDQKVCAIKNGKSCENDIGTTSTIRNRLKQDVANMPFLNRFDYGNPENLPGAPAFSGFAGGENDWQFTLSWQTNFSDYPGEVWADMFLGWVYGNLATDRMNYMNQVMPEYLSSF